MKFVRRDLRTAPLPSDEERGVIPSVDVDKYGRQSPSPTVGIIETPPRGIPIASRLSLTRRVTDPGLSNKSMTMAWRPYENLIDGELDNRTPGKVAGWLRFFRKGKKPLKVTLDLGGDFHEDIRGSLLRLKNPEPSDKSAELDRKGTYMDGFCPVQKGTVGDITAGFPLATWTEALARDLKQQLEIRWQMLGIEGDDLERRRRETDAEFAENVGTGKIHYAYVDYPYIEWYADNGRVVLELDPSQIEVVRGDVPPKPKSPTELVEDEQKRAKALGEFMTEMVQSLSEANRRSGGDGNVRGMVVG